MVPVLAVNMALRLCIECAQKETPAICEALDTAQDNNEQRKLRSLAEKKKHYSRSASTRRSTTQEQ
ncbi:MAG: hypothetical protein SGPRY_006057, partial [Prymnesium sp.]